MAEILISNDKGETYQNMYADLGALPLKGFYNELLQPYQYKEPIFNDSRLQDGTQFVMYPRKADSRICDLGFVIKAENASVFLLRYQKFIEFMERGEIWLKVFKTRTIYKFVYYGNTKMSEFNSRLLCGVIYLSFVEPNPKDRINF